MSFLAEAELLDEIKNFLDITWEDGTANRKLLGIIKRGISYINHIAGYDCDFSEDSKAKELLFEYVRYVRSNALDEFADNYITEIINLQIYAETKSNKESFLLEDEDRLEGD